MPVEQFGIDMPAARSTSTASCMLEATTKLSPKVVAVKRSAPRCGIGAEFDRALLGYCAEFVLAVPTPVHGDRSGGHRGASSSSRGGPRANRSPSRCSTKLRTTRSM